MDPRYITPFIASIKNVFSTMMQLEVRVEEPTLKELHTAKYDASAIIGLSGEVVGSVILSLPGDTAERVAGLFTGTEMSLQHPDFPDAIGELVNMIAGGAKAQFPLKSVSISTPSVILGEHHSVLKQKEIQSIVIPCTTDCGELAIEVAVKAVEKQAGAPAAARKASV